ncbi:MAG: GntR family transcriptional regulator [Erysipelotrichia bacterium]|nr:GntR family transcriptional regulator [Erysipelotrichia bacterium]
MIIQRIRNNEFLPGEKLPSERQMAETYNINRMTVKNAINELVKEGYVYKAQNISTFVTKDDADHRIYFGEDLTVENTGLSAILNEAGFVIESKVIEKGVVKNLPYLADKLHIKNEISTLFL